MYIKHDSSIRVTFSVSTCHTYEWVMSDIQLSHVKHLDESCHTCECVMSDIQIRHVAHDMSHVWMSHVSGWHTDESGHTYGWVKSHIQMRYVTHTNESCLTYRWVMSHSLGTATSPRTSALFIALFDLFHFGIQHFAVLESKILQAATIRMIRGTCQGCAEDECQHSIRIRACTHLHLHTGTLQHTATQYTCNTHSHSHTHTRTHTFKHIRTHACSHELLAPSPWIMNPSYNHVRTYVRACALRHSFDRSLSIVFLTYTFKHIADDMCMHIYIHMYTCMYIHTYIYMYTYIYHYTLQYTLEDHNTLQYTLEDTAIIGIFVTHCYILPHTATHCHTLPHTATHCNTLQHATAHCNTHWRNLPS